MTKLGQMRIRGHIRKWSEVLELFLLYEYECDKGVSGIVGLNFSSIYQKRTDLVDAEQKYSHMWLIPTFLSQARLD